MNCFTEERLNKISHLIQEIERLTDVEKLFLYIQLPSGKAEGKSKFNGTKSNLDLLTKKPDQETTQTYTWILSHLEVDQNVSLPKQEVYDEYKAFCQANRFEPLCVADFGKAMKHAFPCIKPRRLGQRGSSRYCYSGLRKRYKLQPPSLPDLIEPTFCMANDCSQAYNQIIRECRDNPNECPLNNKPDFTGYEVMNLKIDPAIHQEQFNFNYQNNDQQQQQQPSNHVTQQPNHERQSQSIQSQQQSDQLLPKRRQVDAMTIQTKSAPIKSPYNMKPSSQPPQSYTCTDSIQQPGTPDDDDYRHNYQDLTPVINMFYDGAENGQPASSRNSGSESELPPTTSNFMYQVTSGAPKPANHVDDQSRKPPTSGGNIIRSTALINLNPPPQHFQQLQESNNNASIIVRATTSSNSAGFHGYPHFTHMDGAQIDYCASPFQSPASTPYPIMYNYLPQDNQDYYPPDCMRSD